MVFLYVADSISSPSTSCSPYVSSNCTFSRYSSSFASLETLYHSNNSWKIMEDMYTLQTGTTSIVPSTKNILVRLAFSSASINVDSFSNVNVTLKH
jgi:hypothetical protein